LLFSVELDDELLLADENECFLLFGLELGLDFIKFSNISFMFSLLSEDVLDQIGLNSAYFLSRNLLSKSNLALQKKQ